MSPIFTPDSNWGARTVSRQLVLPSASRSTVPREAIKPVNMIHPLFNILKAFLYNYIFVGENPFLAHADKQCHTAYQSDKGKSLRFF